MAGDIVLRTNLDQLPRTGTDPLSSFGTPYEIEAINFAITNSSGECAAEVMCKQRWEDRTQWVREMVGTVSVGMGGAFGPPTTPFGRVLFPNRTLPEPLKFDVPTGGPDGVKQWCVSCKLEAAGGNRLGTRQMQNPVTKWPAPDWGKYRCKFETQPFQVRTDQQINDILTLARVANPSKAATLTAPELLRYMIRNNKNHVREQPLPPGTPGSGFKIASDTAADRKELPTAVAFKAVAYADVSYTWCRVPVGWPPPAGHNPPPAGPFWPPRDPLRRVPLHPSFTNPTNLKFTRDEFKLCVNDDFFDDVDPMGYNFKPGELKYIGYDDNYKYFDANGDHMMDVVYFFRYKRGGWNKFLNAAGDFVTVTKDGTIGGTPLYTPKNFYDLFRFVPNPL